MKNINTYFMSYTPYIPVYNLNTPDGGPQKPAYVTSDTPIYSSYSGKLIGHGPIHRGSIRSDAPLGHPRHDKPFHVIEFNPANGSYMAHDPMRFK